MTRTLAVLLVLLAGCTPSGGTGGDVPASAPPTASAPSPSAQAGEDLLAGIEPSVVAVIAGAQQGSGVVYSGSGSIVTSAHVVGAAKSVEVGFADGSRAAGRVLATDPVADVAIVQVDRPNLIAADFATTTPAPGTAVFVIGSPLGPDAQITAGVVAGAPRAVPGVPGRALVELLRIDALLGASHSGGAVVDGDGTVVGIAETFPTVVSGAPPPGYAIPAATITATARQLLDAGKARHPNLGAAAATVTLGMAQGLDLGVHDGAVLREVTAGGPAAKAGLRAGDVVTSLNGQSVHGAGDLLGALAAMAPGDTARVELHRGEAGRTVSVVLGELRR